MVERRVCFTKNVSLCAHTQGPPGPPGDSGEDGEPGDDVSRGMRGGEELGVEEGERGRGEMEGSMYPLKQPFSRLYMYVWSTQYETPGSLIHSVVPEIYGKGWSIIPPFTHYRARLSLYACVVTS